MYGYYSDIRMISYYGSYYLVFLLLIVVLAIAASVAGSKVNSTFKKHNRVSCRSGMTGEQAARRLLQMNGVSDIAVGRVAGELTDHYHPIKRVVNLSALTYDSNSVAAVAVAAHEIGHVMQNKDGYGLYRVRTALVPMANIGSRLAIPLVFLGVVLDLFVQLSNENLGFYIAILGAILYSTSFLFALVTLPVELNASRRAGAMLLRAGVIREDEIPAVRKVLSAAAMTYLISTLMSLMFLLRFLAYILMAFGRNRRR